MTVVEICVDDLEGALIAQRGGADRIELCADLIEGGTTPSIGLVDSVLGAVDSIGVQIMIRPRGGDFVYSETELQVMCADLRAIGRLVAGSRMPVGFVLGALTRAGTVDVAAMRRLLTAAGAVPVTFHKAFDATADLVEAFDALRDLGVGRILTSGGAATAADGARMLRLLVDRANGVPAILAGGSVRATNVAELIAATGVHEVHLRAQVPSPRGDGGLATDLGRVHAVVTAAAGNGSAALDPADTAVVLALDIGGTTLKGAIVDSSGHVLTSRTTDTAVSGDALLRRVRDLLGVLADEAADADRAVVAAGVVTPGIVETSSGIVGYASSLGWTDVPLGAVLSADLGIPVAIGHDVRSAGLAEALFGAAAGLDDFVLVALGTGVAASIVSSTAPVTGARDAAGELGHIPVIPHGERCVCGQRGCLEVYTSGAGIARRYLALGGPEPLTAEQISLRAHSDPVAAQVWADAVDALSLGLTSLTLLVDPSVFVLGGGVSSSGETLLAPLRESLAASLAWREAPAIRRSPLGTAGGRIGASVLAFRTAGLGRLVTGWTTEAVLAAPHPHDREAAG
jgi:glucokinase